MKGDQCKIVKPLNYIDNSQNSHRVRSRKNNLTLIRIHTVQLEDNCSFNDPSQSELLILAVYSQYLGNLKVLEQFLAHLS